MIVQSGVLALHPEQERASEVAGRAGDEQALPRRGGDMAHPEQGPL